MVYLPAMQNSMVRSLLSALLAAAALVSASRGATQGREEVPFITSPDNVTLEMLRSARVGPRDHVIDLGSGDGRIVILAAKRFGATGLGVEIVPDLVKQSNESARRVGVAGKVKFLEQDLFKTDLSQASVITMYLLPEVNMDLRPRVLQLKPGTRIVSHDWDMGDWLPDQTVLLPVPDKTVGIEKSSRVHLWIVPARVDGLWCGRGATQLRITQRHQMFTATVAAGATSRALAGKIDGAVLHTAGGGRLALDAAGQQIAASGSIAGLPLRTRFTRATGSSCAG